MSSQFWPEISFYLKEIEAERKDINIHQLSQEKFGEIQKAIMGFLEQLKVSLDRRLDPKASQLVYFALIASVDEDMQSFAHSHSLEWLPLQKLLIGDSNAGITFYKKIDEIFSDNSRLPSIVYEVFYFALKRGFKGKYENSKTQIAKYLELLNDKIAKVAAQRHVEPETAPEKPPSRFKRKHYYASAMVASVLFIALLYINSYLG